MSKLIFEQEEETQTIKRIRFGNMEFEFNGSLIWLKDCAYSGLVFDWHKNAVAPQDIKDLLQKAIKGLEEFDKKKSLSELREMLSRTEEIAAMVHDRKTSKEAI